jgi:hypothetical protein
MYNSEFSGGGGDKSRLTPPTPSPSATYWTTTESASTPTPPPPPSAAPSTPATLSRPNPTVSNCGLVIVQIDNSRETAAAASEDVYQPPAVITWQQETEQFASNQVRSKYNFQSFPKYQKSRKIGK